MSQPDPDDAPANGGEITNLLIAASKASDAEDRNKLWNDLYLHVEQELRIIARRRINSFHAGDKWDSLGLAGAGFWKTIANAAGLPRETKWEDRQQFFGFVANSMYQILRDEKRSLKVDVTLDESHSPASKSASISFLDLLLDCESAYTLLKQDDPEAAMVFILVKFGGFTHSEIAEQVLNASERTVERISRRATLKLAERMNWKGPLS